jgi:hypothetical protein
MLKHEIEKKIQLKKRYKKATRVNLSNPLLGL